MSDETLGQSLALASRKPVSEFFRLLGALGKDGDDIDLPLHGDRGVIPSAFNVKEYLRRKLGEHIRYNEMKHQLEVCGRPVANEDAAAIAIHLQSRYRKLFLPTHVEMAFDSFSHLDGECRYHPVQDYLTSLAPIKPGKDPIADLIDAGVIQVNPEFAEWKELFKQFLRCFFIGAVARVFDPGCKHDCALILQGKQGVGKSTFFKSLCLEESWFTDSSTNIDNKDAYMVSSSVWIHEWAELSQIQKSNKEEVKRFLSSATDTYRPPYGRRTVEVKRASVIVGSTNEDRFLSDDENRRFWVIPVESIDVTRVEQMKDSLWSQAIDLYNMGEKHFLPKEWQKLHGELNEDFVDLGPWYEDVMRWQTPPAGELSIAFIDGFYETTTSQVLGSCLNISAPQRTRSAETRVGTILQRLGWSRSRIRRNGHLIYVYRKDTLSHTPTPSQPKDEE